jgi:hypothetical protein
VTEGVGLIAVRRSGPKVVSVKLRFTAARDVETHGRQLSPMRAAVRIDP